jgi:uncharacterized membrane protein
MAGVNLSLISATGDLVGTTSRSFKVEDASCLQSRLVVLVLVMLVVLLVLVLVLVLVVLVLVVLVLVLVVLVLLVLVLVLVVLVLLVLLRQTFTKWNLTRNLMTKRTKNGLPISGLCAYYALTHAYSRYHTKAG